VANAGAAKASAATETVRSAAIRRAWRMRDKAYRWLPRRRYAAATASRPPTAPSARSSTGL
jgi:hypothetical protein